MAYTATETSFAIERDDGSVIASGEVKYANAVEVRGGNNGFEATIRFGPLKASDGDISIKNLSDIIEDFVCPWYDAGNVEALKVYYGRDSFKGSFVCTDYDYEVETEPGGVYLDVAIKSAGRITKRRE